MEHPLLPQWKWLQSTELNNDTAWWKVYHASFPATERDSKEQLLSALEQGLATVGSYKLQNSTVAIIVFYPLSGELPFIFLNYIAVTPSIRSQGLGRQLMASFTDYVKELSSINQSNYAAIVWEVEDPQAANSTDEKAIRERRIVFYKSKGAELLNNKFIQPPIDGIHTVSMRLMYHSLSHQINIHEHEQQIISAIYFKKYITVNHINPEIILTLINEKI